MSEKKCSKPLCGKASPADANKKIVADFMAPASATRTRMCLSHPHFFCCKVIHLAKIGIMRQDFRDLSEKSVEIGR